MKKSIPYTFRISELLVALVFIAGAVLKALDINIFSVQISAYGVIENKGLLPVAALFTLSVETLLGMALLLGMRFRGFLFAAYEVLLAVFTGLIIYGWIYHDLEDCGCFGALEMSPGVSITKNVVLALLVAYGWYGYFRIERRPGSWKGFLAKIPVCLLAALVMTGYAWTDLEDVKPVKEGDRPFAKFVFDNEFGQYDLGIGEYLVVMLSMDCEHCMAETPKLMDLMLQPDVPPLVGLCLEENEGDLEQFILETGADFPMFKVGPLTYFNFIGDDTFRVYLVRDGESLRFWDAKPPSWSEVLLAREGEGE